MKRLVFINLDNSQEAQLSRIGKQFSDWTISNIQSATHLSDLLKSIDEQDEIIIADPQLINYESELATCIANNKQSETEVFTFSYTDNQIKFTELRAETAIENFTQYADLPLLIAKTSGSVFKAVAEMSTINAREAIGQCIITSIAECRATGISNLIIDFSKYENAPDCSLSKPSRSKLISYLIGSINIEELFPNHAWKEHEEESAAACFHTLAACFIRFEDYTAAEECLSFSDRLEDSPRSLALRGLISKHNGETLGAVANLVSSLQQYESRKANKSSESHYISFAPKDIEIINSNLSEGLSALNKKENEKAYTHFAAAVFNFDNFFTELGVDSKDIQ